MQLEVLSAKAKNPNGKPPILLVHGAWHGAWCWQGNFLEYFAAQGFDTYAMSLRGHGGSAGADQLRGTSYADYVADVAQVVGTLGTPPILIGHSMGGYVVQKYLEVHEAAGGVLLGSVPTSGTLRFNLRVLGRNPLKWLMVNVKRTAWPLMENPAHANHWLFSGQVDEATMAAHHAQMGDESYQMSLDMLMQNLPKPELVKTPIAVIAAGRDAIFSVASEEKTAKAYGVEAKIFPDMPHNMMGVPGWEVAAQHIESWIENL